MMEQILVERRLLQLPPFGYLGIIRAEASEPGLADELLLALRQNIEPGAGETAFIGPLPPPIARRAGRFRSQLLLKHTRRGLLHQVLDRAVSWLQQRVKSRKLRWSVDVDPQDFI
jgi:primosomal protein N' (replication factor Y)